MIENVVEYFRNLPAKQCASCGDQIEEMHECYSTQCETCTSQA